MGPPPNSRLVGRTSFVSFWVPRTFDPPAFSEYIRRGFPQASLRYIWSSGRPEIHEKRLQIRINEVRILTQVCADRRPFFSNFSRPTGAEAYDLAADKECRISISTYPIDLAKSSLPGRHLGLKLSGRRPLIPNAPSAALPRPNSKSPRQKRRVEVAISAEN